MNDDPVIFVSYNAEWKTEPPAAPDKRTVRQIMVEAITKYRRFRHGEAVAYGMLVAAEVAVGRDGAAASMRDRLANLIRTLGPLPAIGDLDAREVVSITRRDKKVVDGKLYFVLATGIGSWRIADDVTEDELYRALVTVGFKA